MRNNQEKEHDQVYSGKHILKELGYCGIFDVFEYEGFEGEDGIKGEFALYSSNSQFDPLIITRDELKKLGLAIVELSEKNATFGGWPIFGRRVSDIT